MNRETGDTSIQKQEKIITPQKSSLIELVIYGFAPLVQIQGDETLSQILVCLSSRIEKDIQLLELYGKVSDNPHNVKSIQSCTGLSVEELKKCKEIYKSIRRMEIKGVEDIIYLDRYLRRLFTSLTSFSAESVGKSKSKKNRSSYQYYVTSLITQLKEEQRINRSLRRQLIKHGVYAE